jgi:hypothetical protein
MWVVDACGWSVVSRKLTTIMVMFPFTHHPSCMVHWWVLLVQAGPKPSFHILLVSQQHSTFFRILLNTLIPT